MEDKLFLGAGSSLFVSTGALVVFGGLAILSAVFACWPLCAVLAFLFFFCLVSRLWGESALRDVEVRSRAAPGALFPPGEVEMEMHIRNRKLLPVIWLEVVQLLDENAPLIPADSGEVRRVSGVQARLEGAEEEEAAFLYKKFTFVMGGEQITWNSRWIARRRGIFRSRGLRLRGGDGFGLTQRDRPAGGAEDAFVAVYPAVQPVSAELFFRDMWEASGGTRGYLEDPTVIRSTRDYLPTDSYRRINWRVTARSQRTVVNTYETILPRAAHFIFDGESFNGPVPQAEALEDTLSILTSVILRLDAAGIRCSISLCRSRDSGPREILGADGTPLEEILTAFAGYALRELVRPEEGKPYARPAEFHDYAVLALRDVGRFYYVCSDLARVRRRGLMYRLDPARTTLLPYAGASGGRLGDFAVVGLQTLKRREGT